jgi:hypothetical protein
MREQFLLESAVAMNQSIFALHRSAVGGWTLTPRMSDVVRRGFALVNLGKQ